MRIEIGVAQNSLGWLPLRIQRTVEPETKLEPITVRVNAEPPAVTLAGDSEVNAGTGLFIVKVCPPEVPPPGAGLNTVTVAVPAVAMSAAVIDAVTCVALTYAVVRLDPFHCTVDAPMKFVPLIVSVNAAPPAVADVGVTLVVVGTGLGVTGVMVNV